MLGQYLWTRELKRRQSQEVVDKDMVETEKETEMGTSSTHVETTTNDEIKIERLWTVESNEANGTKFRIEA